MKHNHLLNWANKFAATVAKPTFVDWVIVGEGRLCNRWCRFICVLLLGMLLPASAVLAHGGGELQVANVPIASYQVSVWTNPPTARAGEAIHITVGIGTAVSGEPVLDATVTVFVLTAAGETVTMASATTEQSVNRLFYEADLTGITSGSYQLRVQVTGTKGSGDLSFPLIVSPASFWPWVAGGLVGGAVLWLGVRFWRNGSQSTVPRRRTAVPRPRSVD